MNQAAYSEATTILAEMTPCWPRISRAIFGTPSNLDTSTKVTTIKHQVVAGSTAGLWRIEGNGNDGRSPATAFFDHTQEANARRQRRRPLACFGIFE